MNFKPNQAKSVREKKGRASLKKSMNGIFALLSPGHSSQMFFLLTIDEEKYLSLELLISLLLNQF